MARLPQFSRQSQLVLLFIGLAGLALWLGSTWNWPSFQTSDEVGKAVLSHQEAEEKESTAPSIADELSKLGAPNARQSSGKTDPVASLLDQELLKTLKSAGKDLRAGRAFSMTEHGRVGRFKLALDEIYYPAAPVHERLRKIPAHADAGSLLSYAEAEAQRLGKWPGLVIYPEEGPIDSAHRRVLTEQVLLRSNDTSAAEKVALKNGLQVTDRPDFAPQHLITKASNPLAAVDAMAVLKSIEGIENVEPLLMRERKGRALLNDTFFRDQWHLNNTGQVGGKIGVDIAVKNVWDTYQGEGVRIAIVDDGLQLNHPDLVDNIDVGTHFDWNDFDTDPSPDTQADYHGTAVGGLVAARGNNNLGVSGAAPKAKLSGYRLIAGLVTDETEAHAMIKDAHLIHIKNNSWGMNTGPYDLGSTGELMAEAMSTAAGLGRSGLGTIFTWASGNGRAMGNQGNKDGYSNSMYAIAVGAITNKGNLTFYSETGSHICVVAPSAESTAGIVTTDLKGISGYNNGLNLKNIYEVDYTNNFNGTSAATPIVSGVIALMLEANPNLNWRDVKEILLRSSTKLNPTDKGWVERSGGLDHGASFPPIKHHHSFGGGLINAEAAVNMAKNWTSLGSMMVETLTQTPPITTSSLTAGGRAGTEIIISTPEETKPKTKVTRLNVDFRQNTALRVENVTVEVSASHNRKGDLTIQLVSPTGTVSTLASYSTLDTGKNYEKWLFSSVRHWGESSRGIWSVVASEPEDSVDGEMGDVVVRLYGTSYPSIDLITAPVSKVVPEGSSVSFTGQTTVSGHTAKQWLKNSTAIAGATSDTFTINQAAMADAALYTYVAENLTTKINPTIGLGVVRMVLPPQKVLQGQTAIFKVTAAGPYDGKTSLLRYKWFVGSTALDDDGRITGTETNTLTIRRASQADARDYYCRVSVMDGLPLNTPNATLTITIPPSLEPLVIPPATIVSENIDYPIIADNGATSYKVTGLPPGLKLNAKTGHITGRPSKLGTYRVTVTASNAAGSSQSRSFDWVVADLPLGLVGNYRGVVNRSLLYNNNYGGLLTLTIGKTGTFTGTLTRGKLRTAIKGSLDTYPGQSYATINLRLPRPLPAPPLEFTFTVNNGQINGSLGHEDEDYTDFVAYRLWTSLPSPLGALPGLYNIPLVTSQTNDIYPLGSGYLASTLNAKGTLSYTGRLADGTSLTGSSAMGEGGILPLHHMLYTNLGSVQGTLTLIPSPAGVSASLDWFKSPNSTLSYPNGFSVHSLTGTGSRYTPLTVSVPVLNLPATSNNSRLLYSRGGLFISFDQLFTLASNNTAQFSGNPHQLQLTVNAKTGLLTGKGIAMEVDPLDPLSVRKRAGSYSGLIIPNLNRSEGYFLLPINTSKTAPVLSGRFILQSASASY